MRIQRTPEAQQVAAGNPSERRLGPWRLIEELGSGGNATVWRAVSVNFPDPVALKIINTTHANREPYQRFVREIDFLRSLEDATGVLPLLDAHLPDKPSKVDKPWLAMPIARLLADALREQPLEVVVSALAVIAATLSRLAKDHDVAHRDIKPDNLYQLDGDWLVGDFGLVALPTTEKITRSDRPLGPTFYRPYEMIENPKEADPFPADVYAFGKTLWVLATGQNYPPSGHQPATTRKFSIADLRVHPHAALLDELVDRATRLDPTQRPTMGEIASDLDRWTALAAEPPILDLSEARARLQKQLADELDADDLLEQRKELALAAVRRMNEIFAPLDAGLKSVHPRAQVNIPPDQYMTNVLSTLRTSGSPEIVFKFLRMSQITSGPSHWIFALRLGRGLELTAEGETIVRVHIDVSHPGMSGTTCSWHSEEYVAPVGSVETVSQLQEAYAATQTHLKEALEAFLDELSKSN